MIKKITAIALSVLLFTACNAEEKEEQITGTTPAETTVTTPLTLTEIITEEIPFIPEEEEKQEVIELAVFNPFEDSIKVEDEVYRELSEAVEKISDGRAFLNNNLTGFYADNNTVSKYYTAYADTDNVLEKSIELEYDFCPINSEIAETEEELFEYVRGIFTEDLHTDEEIRKFLFSPESHDNQPCYKMIDDKLCMKLRYNGVMSAIDFGVVEVASYEENRAEIRSKAVGISYPDSIVFLTLVKSEEYGWRLDSIEFKEYWEREATILYNGVKLREEQLNAILSGGVQPENPRTTTVDGESYTETNTGMSLSEMQGFFTAAFCEYIWDYQYAFENNDYENAKSVPLRDRYITKYIDDVYYELDGVLYRKDSAPKWYTPELTINPYGEMKQSGGGARIDDYFVISQPYYDFVKDENFNKNITIIYDAKYDENFNYESCSFIHIASELTIREMVE